MTDLDDLERRLELLSGRARWKGASAETRATIDEARDAIAQLRKEREQVLASAEHIRAFAQENLNNHPSPNIGESMAIRDEADKVLRLLKPLPEGPSS